MKIDVLLTAAFQTPLIQMITWMCQSFQKSLHQSMCIINLINLAKEIVITHKDCNYVFIPDIANLSSFKAIFFWLDLHKNIIISKLI